jgi:hypothetical protein
MEKPIDGRIALCWVCPNCEDNNQVNLKDAGYDTQNMNVTGWAIQAQCQSCQRFYVIRSE